MENEFGQHDDDLPSIPVEEEAGVAYAPTQPPRYYVDPSVPSGFTPRVPIVLPPGASGHEDL